MEKYRIDKNSYIFKSEEYHFADSRNLFRGSIRVKYGGADGVLFRRLVHDNERRKHARIDRAVSDRRNDDHMLKGLAEAD